MEFHRIMRIFILTAVERGNLPICYKNLIVTWDGGLIPSPVPLMWPE